MSAMTSAAETADASINDVDEVVDAKITTNTKGKTTKPPNC